MIKLILLKFRSSNFTLFILALILFAIGLMTLKSIESGQSLPFIHQSFYKQLIFIIPAIMGLLIAFMIPRHTIHRYIYSLFGIIMIFILIPYFGREIAHTYRWIDLGLPVGFQPSEFAKWIVVIALARYLSDHNLQMTYFSANIFPVLIALLPAFIILNQPDLGTAIIIMVPVLPMLYWAGSRPFHLFLFLAPLISILTAFHWLSFTIWAVSMMIIIYRAQPTILFGISTFFSNVFLGLLSPVLWGTLKDYQQKRILTLFNPELDPLGAAYQIIQSKTAIGAGGLFGKGWGQGTQTHLKFLPVQESDFIVSVIGEEFGFIAIFILITIFTLFILKTIRLAYNIDDRFSSLTIVGIASIFTAHVFVNFAMTVGMIPVKGLPLPFVSYGGSFLLSSFIMIGLIMNLSIDPKEY
ncbi:MAG: FtsW/RodA/SpoVE family cell cycle protein [Fidelibacterota bacterium]